MTIRHWRILPLSGLILFLMLAAGAAQQPSRAQTGDGVRLEAEAGMVSRVGSWVPVEDAAASGGQFLLSSGAGDDALSLSFGGPALEIIAWGGPDAGSLAVEVDGVLLRTVSLAADEAGPRTITVDYLADGPHLVRVYPAAGRVALDAFIVAEALRAEVRLSGTVVDGDTGQPIPGAAVQVDEQTIHSGRAGAFAITLPQLPAQKYVDVRVTAPGYGAWRMAGLYVTPEHPHHINHLRLFRDGRTVNGWDEPVLYSGLRDPAALASPHNLDPALLAGRAGEALSVYDPLPETIRVAITGYVHCWDWLDAGSPVQQVITVNTKDYVKDVLPREWISSWPDESLRAGAMAVKHFTWWRYAIDPDGIRPGNAHLVDNTCDQYYVKDTRLESWASRANAAVDHTWDVTMKLDDKVKGIHYLAYESQCPDDWFRCMGQWETKWDADAGYHYDSILHRYYDPIQIVKSNVPANLNVVQNAGFEAGIPDWVAQNVDYSTAGGVLALRRPAGSSGVVYQKFSYRYPAGTPIEVTLQLGNNSGADKTPAIHLRDTEVWDNARSCQFSVEAGAPLEPYIMRFVVPEQWENMMLELWPAPDDGLPNLLVDNVSVVAKPGLSVSGTECIDPAPATGQATNLLASQLNAIHPHLSWNGPQNADWFRVYLRRESPVSMVWDHWLKREDVCSPATGTACGVTVPVDLLNGQSYSFWVRTWGQAAGYGAWSVGHEFTLTIPAPLAPYDLSLQAHHGTPVFNWMTDENAHWFNVAVFDDEDHTLLNTWYERDAGVNCPADACSLDSELNLLNGTYRWQVRAWGPGGTSNWTAGATFNLALAPPATPDAATFTLSDDPGSAYRRFGWQAVDRAAWYRVYIAQGGSMVHDSWYRGLDVCTAGACGVAPPVSLPAGTYSMWVLGWGAGGMGEWSAGATLVAE
jgi:hypothetical protein